MSNKALISVVFLVLATVASAQLICYYGTTTQTGNSVIGAVTPVNCGYGTYCQKNYQKNYSYKNYQTNSYGCATGQCSRSGCTENSNGYGTCCCRGNYCNSGFDYSKTAVSSMVLTVASVVYMYF
ncbi:CBN-TAG-234 protein [Caenorhabditis brenneri]|uniref:CBN-TAG-234 protein n=1 Tax=Caenorhabditis brenneri TaxID=135651 RepID=G0MZB5_CAEBE|nr:CBN-TAG-234 protein [Caenorhabditis brenneri]